jgi:hypothetical protein
VEPVMLTERSCSATSVYSTDFFAFDSNHANRCACAPVLAIQPKISLMVRVQPEGKGGAGRRLPQKGPSPRKMRQSLAGRPSADVKSRPRHHFLACPLDQVRDCRVALPSTEKIAPV